MTYFYAFIVGGIICVIGQILMDLTKLTPARILVLFVVSGVILQGLGFYQYLVDIGGAGATVPLPGFGYALAKGVIQEVQTEGFQGVFTGGISATAGGVTAAMLFGYFASVLFDPKTKK